MDRHAMLDNIREHSIVVARVAKLLTEGLNQCGSQFSLELVVAGALLHDIGKTLCLGTGEDHALKGREICLREDFAEVADMVGHHIVLPYAGVQVITEVELVYYSDKRVNHDTIVTLDQRRAYILDIYGNSEFIDQKINDNFDRCQMLEKKIFADLAFVPEDLDAKVAQTASLGAEWDSSPQDSAYHQSAASGRQL